VTTLSHITVRGAKEPRSQGAKEPRSPRSQGAEEPKLIPGKEDILLVIFKINKRRLEEKII